ncbi:MAG: Stk1 family PASTA domain-containing Ser/Thr kinase [Lachnospiraceae bacterium]|nr:Stk1 family PASTA domain-containing Ser/Thr kinase [Lachnospiraceae bacterium]
MVIKNGTILGNRYEIIGKIGSGGMSDVYKARDAKLNRFVAIKILKEEFSVDQGFVSKFRMEAQSAACLSHPNIVNIFDVGEENGIYYIVMELIEGITLKKYIERRKKLGIRESIEVSMQVSRGLQAAHAEHIIHRDIKPQNIMISKDGKIKVTDFGIARAVSSQTISSNTMGSVHYICPEQAKGGYCDERSDIYSLGITMYEMLTGRVPFEGDSTVAVALQHIQGEMVPPRQYEPLIPIGLEKIILKCTQKRPENRYSSAAELLADLKRVLTSPNDDFRDVNPVEPPVKQPVKPTSKTGSFNTDDLERQRQATERINQEKLKEEQYQMGVEVDSEDPTPVTKKNNKNSDDTDEEEADSKFEKIVIYIGIGIAVAIVTILAIIFFKTCDFFDRPEESSVVTTENQSVKMINLLGMTYKEAESALNKLGLHMKASYEESDDYPEGQIFDQDIAEGDVLEANTVVNVKISSGGTTIMIPTGMQGKSLSDVKTILSQAGFTNVNSSYTQEYSDYVEKGMVIRVDPAEGSNVPKDTEISIVLSMGKATVMVEVPDLKNMSEEDARILLASKNLVVGSVDGTYSDTVEKGKIVYQNPEQGSEVPENTPVSFVVSKGSDSVEVPDLRGDTQAEAKAKLERLGLKMGEITYEYCDEQFTDKIISQSVDAGEKLKLESKVDIIIGLGPEPILTASVPDLTGKTMSAANKVLRDAGFNLGDITEEFSETIPLGRVISQSPAAGTELELESPVDIVLSKGQDPALHPTTEEVTEPPTEPPTEPVTETEPWEEISEEDTD